MALQPATFYRWSHDGNAFEVGGVELASGKPGLWRIDAATGELLLLAPLKEGEGQGTEWSPDGKSLYFRRKLDGGKGIAIVQRDVASGSEMELARAADFGRMRVSPDGRYISLYSSDKAAHSLTMVLIPTAGGEMREILRKPAQATDKWPPEREGYALFAWALDSHWLLVRSRAADEKQGDEVWRVSLDGGAPRKLELDSNLGWPGFPSLHPDGKRIAYVAPVEESVGAREVRVLENFLPAPGVKR